MSASKPKTFIIGTRVSPSMGKTLIRIAKKSGFLTLSDFTRYLYREEIKRLKKEKLG